MSFFGNILARASGVTPDEPAPDTLPSATPPAPLLKTALRKYQPASPSTYVSDLAAPLVKFSRQDPWTLADACAATHIFGGNGSGKTSGSGQTLAKAYLRAGFGGLVLCAKDDECATWQRYAAETGRNDDVIIVSKDTDWRFNLIHYEIARHDNPAIAVENLLTTFMNVLTVSAGEMDGENQIWRDAAEQLLRHLFLVAIAAIPDFTLFDLMKLLATAPTKVASLDSDEFLHSDFGQTFAKARSVYEERGLLDDFQSTEFYWLYSYPNTNDRTRSSAVFTLTTMLQHLQAGTVRQLFSTGLNVFPEDSHEGAIIILDLPVTGNNAHRVAQALFKVVWQTCTARRNVDDQTRPVFLWADESQFFITPSDTDFQSIARSYRACTVYLTQNISSYYQRFGGNQARDMTDAFLGYFQTMIFHAQPNVTTNQFAQNLFGKVIKQRASVSEGTSDNTTLGYSWNSSMGHSGAQDSMNYGTGQSDSYSHGSSFTVSRQEQTENQLEMGDLTSLKTGTEANNFMVGAYLFSTGTVWKATGTNCLYTEFSQRIA